MLQTRRRKAVGVGQGQRQRCAGVLVTFFLFLSSAYHPHTLVAACCCWATKYYVLSISFSASLLSAIMNWFAIACTLLCTPIFVDIIDEFENNLEVGGRSLFLLAKQEAVVREAVASFFAVLLWNSTKRQNYTFLLTLLHVPSTYPINQTVTATLRMFSQW